MSKIDHILSGHVYSFVTHALKSNAYNYLEIGIFNGAGFADVANQFPKKRCYAVDPFIEDGHTRALTRTETGQKLNLQQASAFAHIQDLKNAEIFVTTSLDYRNALNPDLVEQLNVGVVLIDGDHHYPSVVNDYRLAMDLINTKEGYIIFDDTDLTSVKQAYDEMLEEFASRIAWTQMDRSAISVKVRSL